MRSLEEDFREYTRSLRKEKDIYWEVEAEYNNKAVQIYCQNANNSFTSNSIGLDFLRSRLPHVPATFNATAKEIEVSASIDYSRQLIYSALLGFTKAQLPHLTLNSIDDNVSKSNLIKRSAKISKFISNSPRSYWMGQNNQFTEELNTLYSICCELSTSVKAEGDDTTSSYIPDNKKEIFVVLVEALIKKMKREKGKRT